MTLSLSLSHSPTQELLENFEKNKHKLHSKTTELKSDKATKEQSLFDILEDEDTNNAGDFRSKDCIELLKQADIVVTNPPFSLFREYVAQLMEFDKKFLIIGNQNAITYKEIFKLIKANQIWLGYGFRGGAGHFINIHYEDYATASDHKEGMIRVSGVNWFTNLDIKQRHEPLETIHFYSKSPEKYPKYDNYNAINVDKTAEIPMDYEGVMGVPITFLDKYNPEQFEILALGNSRDNFTPTKDYISPKKHLKNGSVVNGGAINCVLALETDKLPFNQIYYTSENSKYLLPPYARILIKRKDKK
nr:adenine-specific methyltransferase EcoRI family protein [Campylobacter troglodytis]